MALYYPFDCVIIVGCLVNWYEVLAVELHLNPEEVDEGLKAALDIVAGAKAKVKHMFPVHVKKLTHISRCRYRSSGCTGGTDQTGTQSA